MCSIPKKCQNVADKTYTVISLFKKTDILSTRTCVHTKYNAYNNN